METVFDAERNGGDQIFISEYFEKPFPKLHVIFHIGKKNYGGLDYSIPEIEFEFPKLVFDVLTN